MKPSFAILALSLCVSGCCELAYGPTQCRLQEPVAIPQQAEPVSAPQAIAVPPQALMPAAGPATPAPVMKPLRVGGEWPEGQPLTPPPLEHAPPPPNGRWLHM